MTFRKGAEREIYRGPLISVAVGEFHGPDGAVFERDIVHHPGAVSVVAIVDGDAVLVRQYRAAVDRDLLEIPAGKRDIEGEPPERAAARELEEEVGLHAANLELLAEFYNSPGFTDEHSYVFLASGLTEVAARPVGVEEQAMVVERVPLADVPALIASGEIVDGKTIIGLSLARDRLHER